MRQFHPEVRREARRLARDMIKDAIRKRGHKVSNYYASDICKGAEVLIHSPHFDDMILVAWGTCKMRWESNRA